MTLSLRNVINFRPQCIYLLKDCLSLSVFTQTNSQNQVFLCLKEALWLGTNYELRSCLADWDLGSETKVRFQLIKSTRKRANDLTKIGVQLFGVICLVKHRTHSSRQWRQLVREAKPLIDWSRFEGASNKLRANHSTLKKRQSLSRKLESTVLYSLTHTTVPRSVRLERHSYVIKPGEFLDKKCAKQNWLCMATVLCELMILLFLKRSLELSTIFPIWRFLNDLSPPFRVAKLVDLKSVEEKMN